MFEEVAFGLTSSKVLRVHRPLPDPAECDARNAASNAVSADGPIGCIWSGPIHDDPGQSPADRQRPAWQKPSTAWPLPAADELFASPMYKERSAPSNAGATPMDPTEPLKTMATKMMFVPSLTWNLLCNQIKPLNRNWWDYIDENIILGGLPLPAHVDMLHADGVRALITLNEPWELLVPPSVFENYGMRVLHLPTRDFFDAPSPEDMRKGIRFLHSTTVRGAKCYVHCKAGRGRSCALVLCYLISHRGMTAVEALRHVEARRPHVRMGVAQWEAVKRHEEVVWSQPARAADQVAADRAHALGRAHCDGFAEPVHRLVG